MLCKLCMTELTEHITFNDIKMQCKTCNTMYDTPPVKKRIYSRNNKRVKLLTNGKTIFAYPCNQKLLKDCVNCKYPLIAYKVIKYEDISSNRY